MAKQTKVKRIPIGGPRDILAVRNQDPNFVYRWVNDTTGRIERFKEAGYEVVLQDIEVGHNTVDRGSKVGSAISRQVGGNIAAVLMRIPKEWYDEDQAAKAEAILEQELSMRAEAEAKADYGKFTVKRQTS